MIGSFSSAPTVKNPKVMTLGQQVQGEASNLNGSNEQGLSLRLKRFFFLLCRDTNIVATREDPSGNSQPYLNYDLSE